MPRGQEEIDESVSISMELTGKYDDVLSKLTTDSTKDDTLTTVTEDFATILATVERIGGGTRSAVSDNLPSDMAVEYGPEDVVPVLQVLERYGHVTLEGNTWNPSE